MGSIRFDLILVVLTFVSLFFQKNKRGVLDLDKTGKILLGFLIYIAISLPFVQWPGTVIHVSMENFFKVIVFFFFTCFTVTDQRRFQILIMVFAGCQVFRVLEPLYLHLTTGYWGDSTFINYETSMDRLAGSPNDFINPNGLAYVCVTAICFTYYLCKNLPQALKIPVYATIPAMVYALLLTGSRSGLIGLMGSMAGIITSSRKKIIFLAVLFAAALYSFQHLGALQQERYLSIYRDDVRGASTAQGRIDGLYRDFEVIMHNPVFGSGLGTSLEANFNITGSAFRSHNLILEVWQEVGLIGLIIFLTFIITGIINCRSALNRLKQSDNVPLLNLARGIGAWFILNIIFAMFSYGLSSYAWYLLAGSSVVLARLTKPDILPKNKQARHA